MEKIAEIVSKVLAFASKVEFHTFMINHCFKNGVKWNHDGTVLKIGSMTPASLASCDNFYDAMKTPAIQKDKDMFLKWYVVSQLFDVRSTNSHVYAKFVTPAIAYHKLSKDDLKKAVKQYSVKK